MKRTSSRNQGEDRELPVGERRMIPFLVNTSRSFTPKAGGRKRSRTDFSEAIPGK
ncbi:hypothetical protein [Schaedlerella arabinosiphila]